MLCHTRAIHTYRIYIIKHNSNYYRVTYCTEAQYTRLRVIVLYVCSSILPTRKRLSKLLSEETFSQLTIILVRFPILWVNDTHPAAKVPEEVNMKSQCHHRNTMVQVQLLISYTDPERHMHHVTDRWTDRRTRHYSRSYCMQQYDRLKTVLVVLWVLRVS